MFPGGRSAMVLRRLHPPFGSGPPNTEFTEFLSSYFPALSLVVSILIISSLDCILGVLSLQNAGACQRRDHAQLPHGRGGSC